MSAKRKAAAAAASGADGPDSKRRKLPVSSSMRCDCARSGFWDGFVKRWGKDGKGGRTSRAISIVEASLTSGTSS